MYKHTCILWFIISIQQTIHSDVIHSVRQNNLTLLSHTAQSDLTPVIIRENRVPYHILFKIFFRVIVNNLNDWDWNYGMGLLIEIISKINFQLLEIIEFGSGESYSSPIAIKLPVHSYMLWCTWKFVCSDSNLRWNLT